LVVLLETTSHYTINVHLNPLFFLLLAPGIVVGLGMPPLVDLVIQVCDGNFVLYGFGGLLLSIVHDLVGASDPPDPVIIKKADE